MYLAGQVNRDTLEEITLDPTGPIGQDQLTRIDRNMDLDNFASRVGGHPPYIVAQRPKIVGETCVQSESDYPYGDDDAYDRNDLIAHYSAIPSE